MTTQNTKSFTLIELMVVVIVISVIAGFAIPNYEKSVERAHLRDAITQLSTIHAANQIYRARTQSYWPDTVGTKDLADINADLGLAVIANGMTYTCDPDPGTPGLTYTCQAVRDAPAVQFTVEVTEAVIDATNPACVAGACP